MTRKLVLGFLVFTAMFVCHSSPVRSSLGARGKSDVVSLPYDAEVEYLETDGACYIDTGVYLRTPIKVECDYYLPNRGNKRLWGAYRQSTINCYQSNISSSVYRGVGVVYNGTTLTLSTYEQPYFPYRATCVFEADVGNQSVSAFGASVAGTNANGLTDTLNCTCGLFGNGRAGYATGENLADAGARVYSWRCWIRGDLLSDFIPVRFTNELGQSEGAMYDRVSGKLFRNAGTGSFVIGPDKE